ncbi:MAG: filamentous hemagglutinin [Alkalinema sp. CACIAM 70d]|nr:MAG: filamentous hemagglutinin [Alkalinema sp. CACIAM 70d]
MADSSSQQPSSRESLVSLIMTVFNREKFLGDAIESALCQSYRNFELIIWDDGSTDRSLEIATHYAQKDARIRLVAAEHQGRIFALQQAHTMAKGSYVGWLDSDDRLAPDTILETAEILDQQPQIGMVYTQYETIDENNCVTGLGRRCKIAYSDLQMLVDFMTFHFRLIRRSIYEQIGGVDSSFPCAIDYDLCLRLAEITEFYHLQKPLYFYREHAESISQRQRNHQIHHAQRAIQNALERRGLSDVYELVVHPPNQFELYRK